MYLICLVLVILVLYNPWIFRTKVSKRNKDAILKFKYKFFRYPFDDPQYFTVGALNQKEANEKAIDAFTKMFNNKQTIMTQFFSVL